MRDAFLEFLDNYCFDLRQDEKKRVLGGVATKTHPIWNTFKTIEAKVKDCLTGIGSSFKTDGQIGNSGRWLKIPYVRVFDPNTAPQASEGVYIVYLISESGDAVYLTLATGGSGYDEVKIDIPNLCALTEELRNGISDKKGFSGILPPGSLGNDDKAKKYEASVILYKKYEKAAFPIDSKLESDLKDLCQIYETYLSDNGKNEELESSKIQPIKDPAFPKNLIFFGAPGTGKTFRTVNQAVAICEKKSLEEIDKMPREELTKKYRELVGGGYIRFVTFHQSYSYEDFVIGIFPTVYGSENKGDIKYEVRSGIFKTLCGAAEDAPHKNYVLIIDEINRGNISRVFGELITLIEDSKRKGESEETTALLPYFDEKNIRTFTVPSNVYIIGTMNTADRSIQHVDTALRRRFVFKEILPDTSLFEKTNITAQGKTLNIKTLLEKINARIKQYYDREHVIGHAYLMPLLKEGLTDDEKLKLLGELFHDRIIPLLQDYFFEDYSKIQKVLGEEEETSRSTSLIWKISDGPTDEDEGRKVFEVAPMGDPAYKNIETYLLMAK